MSFKETAYEICNKIIDVASNPNTKLDAPFGISNG